MPSRSASRRAPSLHGTARTPLIRRERLHIEDRCHDALRPRGRRRLAALDQSSPARRSGPPHFLVSVCALPFTVMASAKNIFFVA
eukprot:816729-Pyramimonas_sp.AAC.1